jgi:hypothetical protein
VQQQEGVNLLVRKGNNQQIRPMSVLPTVVRTDNTSLVPQEQIAPAPLEGSNGGRGFEEEVRGYIPKRNCIFIFKYANSLFLILTSKYI